MVNDSDITHSFILIQTSSKCKCRFVTNSKTNQFQDRSINVLLNVFCRPEAHTSRGLFLTNKVSISAFASKCPFQTNNVTMHTHNKTHCFWELFQVFLPACSWGIYCFSNAAMQTFKKNDHKHINVWNNLLPTAAESLVRWD